MTEHRVAFDFVAHFTNGGSLSSEGFRLDIPGDDIADEALAAYLIQDMRLLMAVRRGFPPEHHWISRKTAGENADLATDRQEAVSRDRWHAD